MSTRLVYSAITSADGYVADAGGEFSWGASDEEVHAFVNEVSRPIGTYLFGRRMFEVLRVWEHLDDPEPVIVGGGLRCLPDNLRLDLELLDERRFTNGVVYLRYGVVR